MKKITTIAFAIQFLVVAFAVPVVNAQTSVSGNGSASGYGYVVPTQTVTSGPAIIGGPPVPVPAPTPIEASGFIQFNDLTIESVSGTNSSAEILASGQNIYPVAVPMMQPASGGVNSGAPAMPSVAPAMNTPAIHSAAPAPTAASGVTCYKFNAQGSGAGTAISCPTPPQAPSSVTAPAQPSTGASAAGTPASGKMAVPAIYPYPGPINYAPYRIEVDASTRLSLRDRTAATLSDFSAGDAINVFGYYNNDGSIQAYLIRDLSKPVQNQFLQLDNVTLASISTGTNPTTFVVAQAQGYPCYGFGSGGTGAQSIACPMGIPATMENSAIQNMSVPAALAPTWQTLRKYVVTVDAQTVILDSNRTTLSLSDLQAGDSLNIYGDTNDNGQTLSADIVRDLSIPAMPETYSGQVTQVNADGSFVVQTNDGRTVTVQNPVQVGATIQLTGLLNRLTGVLTQVSNIYLNGNGFIPPSPMPMGAPAVPNTQSGGSAPAKAGTAPTGL